MLKRLVVPAIISLVSAVSAGQVVTKPAFGLVSHETLSVEGISFGKNETVIELTLENRSLDGYFCIDKNTFMVLPSGERIKMVRSENMPNCPEVYRFRNIGEVLRFRLIFPATPAVPEWFDLTEVCQENCLSVLGITTDSSLNSSIERAYSLAESGMPAGAGDEFRSILPGLEKRGHGLTASVYSGIIVMYLREGNEEKAREWYGMMIKSGAPSLDRYLANLNSRGIRW